MTEYRDIRYRSGDGRLELYARDYPADGPTLLLMHGLTRNSADFEMLAAHLAGRYRLVVPDQRGRGLSQYDPDGTNYRPDLYVEDMWALLDKLEIDTVTAIGTSMGGLMAMVMAATRPARIRAMVLNDIGPEVMQTGLDRIRTYVGGGAVMENWEEAAARCEAINGDAMIGLDASGWMGFARRTCEETPEGGVRFAYDPAISESMADEQPATVPPDLWPMWDMLTDKPVLSIRGAISDLLSPETVAQMRARHRGPFDAVEIAGRGHAPLLDEPVAIAAIDTFLADHG
ncbi:MAG: alpha/beta hydrolase [Sphingomonadales bacterium]|nr:alpha/beta hydrolase [Sphingomonadales bacterium]MBD3771975.1 alpha/beta hydrolase [Paracoccaceae bacterium]